MAEEPEAVDDLPVVADRDLPVALGASREVGGAEGEEPRPGGEQSRRAVERDQRERSERAAASSSSKSGTSPVS